MHAVYVGVLLPLDIAAEMCVAFITLSGTSCPITITMKTTHGLNGTSLVGLFGEWYQKIPGFVLVNLRPNT